MEGKLNFAILVCKGVAPATEKGVAGLRDKLGQDSAKFRWIQLPLQEGRDKRRHWGPLELGASLPSMGTSRAFARPSSGEGKAGSEATDAALHRSSHSPISPLCAILGLWNKSILDRAIASSTAVMVVPCCCFNIPMSYVHDFLGMEHTVIPQTQAVCTLQKQQYKNKVPSAMERKGKGACVWHRLFTSYRDQQWCTRVKGIILEEFGFSLP